MSECYVSLAYLPGLHFDGFVPHSSAAQRYSNVAGGEFPWAESEGGRGDAGPGVSGAGVKPIGVRTVKTQEEGDAWLKTSQRAASKKPWDAAALDEEHYVRKTKAAVAAIKPRIDTGRPRTQNRWRGRNFKTIARHAAEGNMAGVAAKAVEVALDRVDRTDSLVERRKNQFDTVANPALLQRRLRGPSWQAGVQEWKAKKQTIGRTMQETFDAALYSNKPPWVKLLSEDKSVPHGRLRPGNIAVPAGSQLLNRAFIAP